MLSIRNHIVFKIFWGLMILHIFNISIDPPDAAWDDVPEDLSFNEIESIVELVLENVIGIENICPEQDERDDLGHKQIDKKFDFFFEVIQPNRVANSVVFFQKCMMPTDIEDYLPRLAINELFQPPEA